MAVDETPQDGMYPSLILQLGDVGGMRIVGPHETGVVLKALAQILEEEGFRQLSAHARNLYESSQQKVSSEHV